MKAISIGSRGGSDINPPPAEEISFSSSKVEHRGRGKGDSIDHGNVNLGLHAHLRKDCARMNRKGLDVRVLCEQTDAQSGLRSQLAGEFIVPRTMNSASRMSACLERE